jgi:hypothetical protein
MIYIIKLDKLKRIVISYQIKYKNSKLILNNLDLSIFHKQILIKQIFKKINN